MTQLSFEGFLIMLVTQSIIDFFQDQLKKKNKKNRQELSTGTFTVGGTKLNSYIQKCY